MISAKDDKELPEMAIDMINAAQISPNRMENRDRHHGAENFQRATVPLGPCSIYSKSRRMSSSQGFATASWIWIPSLKYSLASAEASRDRLSNRTTTVFLDFASAFDTVLLKLVSLDILGPMVRLVAAYLS